MKDKNIKLFTHIKSSHNHKFSYTNGVYIDLEKLLDIYVLFDAKILVVTGGNLGAYLTAGTDLVIYKFCHKFNIDIKNDISNYDLKLGEIFPLSYKINNLYLHILYLSTVETSRSKSNLEVIDKSYKNLFNYFSDKDYDEIFIPVLGVGFGGLDFSISEKCIANILKVLTKNSLYVISYMGDLHGTQ